MHPDHPNVSDADWKNFCAHPSPFVFDEIIEHGTGEIDWEWLPYARGVAIASEHLLRSAHFKPPKFKAHAYKRGYLRSAGLYELLIYSTHERDFWIIERRNKRNPTAPNDRLVLSLGWTPLATRHFRAAICLGQMALTNRISGVKWVPAR
jgi:hypothetical protein